MERGYPVFKVTKKAEASLKNGHPWVFGDEVVSVEGAYKNGDLADVRGEKGNYLGTGFVNDNSKIRVRIVSRNANDRFDEAFFARRVKYAVDYRRQVMGDEFSDCRLVFGEADMLPGLTVDRFGSVLVTQSLCLGTDLRKDVIFRLLVDYLRELGEDIEAVFERNDVAIRELEGMEQYKAFYEMQGLRTDLDGHIEITENGVKYDVDYINGQKTGFFLDQKYNRLAVKRIAKGRRVLDCFTHTGAFALNAAMGGAEKVTAVDISASAIEKARMNAALNGIEMDFIEADVFDLLTELAEKHSKDYDMIILDPPAFTKSGATAGNAYRGYKEINMKAMKLLPRGGYLATCSCSHFMYDDMFRRMLGEAAHDADVTLRQIEARQQAPDHPILPTVRETDYLKFYLFQVV
ncbi:MAG: class I SAM-dependent rRNA methyltransferase [Clostridiales bacterium]|nr:class I SAM-dependent rRNA methyltransferase [Clostridiales bacterium]